MGRYLGPQCRYCRTERKQLFLKGERCKGPNCAITKKRGAPGKGQRYRIRKVSDYGLQLREKQKISQQELAKSVGVSRQTIYYLERGMSNPSLTLSLDISKILNKPIEEIFYYEPVIVEFLGNKTVDEMDEIANITGFDLEKILNLRKIDDDQLSKNYTEDDLKKIAQALGVEFNILFLKDEV